MLSRVANSIYWINRYIERAENYARFVGVNTSLALDTANIPDAMQWMPLVATTADEELFQELYGEPTQENVFNFLIFDDRNFNSVYSCVMNARENARTIRENISIEMWEHINGFYYLVRNAAKNRHNILPSSREFLKEVVQGSQLLMGIEDSTISHTEGWHFGKLGRYIERADKTARILDVKYFLLLPSVEEVGSVLDMIQWSSVLKSVSAFMMYRRTYGQLFPQKIIEFLILDRYFPRSVYYCTLNAQHILKSILKSHRGSIKTPAMKKLAMLSSELYYTNVKEIINFGMHEYIDRLQTIINEVNDNIHETFFAMKN
ncbi:MAG: alpha-E domain-containing protein [Thermoflexibacter sp.]